MRSSATDNGQTCDTCGAATLEQKCKIRYSCNGYTGDCSDP